MFRNGKGYHLISIQLDRYLTGLIWCTGHKSELAEIFGDVYIRIVSFHYSLYNIIL